MIKNFKNYFFIFFAFLFLSCSTVPFTGRQQLNIIPDNTMLSMSYQEYGDFLKNNKVLTSGEQVNKVKRVGDKIKNSVENYFRQKQMTSEIEGYKWEFNLVDSKDINAWCMPGGKVVVYTGILPLTNSDDELAVVMGHEIAHAIAKHGSERMSQQLLIQTGGMALDAALKEKPQQTKQLWMTAFGLGSSLGIMLPYSRTHEYEADELGLIFMTMAGYQPESAISFWQNMSKQGGAKPPEFLSTHPNDENRIENIKQKIPNMKQYRK